MALTTLQPCNADNGVRSFGSTINRGTEVSSLIGNSVGNKLRTFISFDFSSIPLNAIIESAILTIYYYRN